MIFMNMHHLWFSLLLIGALLAGCSHPSSEDNEQDSLIRAGDRIQANGDPDSAINVYKSALEKNPPNKLPLYLKLGNSYVSTGRLDEAKKVYEEALPIDENNEVKKQLGKVYLMAGKPDPAISIFEGIILHHKDDTKAYNSLGVAYDLRGDHGQAQDYYHQALNITPENDEIKSNLGLSLAFQGKYEDAMKLLQPIGERLDATSKQRHNLALVYSLAGNQAKAQQLYVKDINEGEINKNFQALRMAPKPVLSPSDELDVILAKAEAE